jgi:argonaute-like protein implicated in RNA metabolism and viral defense
MNLNKVTVSLNTSGWEHHVNTYEAKENKSTYSWLKNRVNKNQIMVIDSFMHQSHKRYYKFTWCLDEDLQKAKDILVNRIKEEATEAKDICDKIYTLTHLNP